MSNQFDVIVIGLGVMGTAACRSLARRGLRVLGLEQFDLCHHRGSSHGRSRVIRKAYFEDPRYVPLLQSAYRLWHELEQSSGEQVIQYAGCLNLGPPDHVCVRGARMSAEQHGLPHEVLSAAEVRARWPALHPAVGDVGIYETDAGYVVPERCVQLLANEARAHGAELHEREVVRQKAHPQAKAIRVATDRAEYECRKLVITAGPWLGQIMTGLSMPPLTVERQVQFWFRPPHPARFQVGALPVFIHFVGDRAFYAIPAGSEGLFKAARHHGGEPTTPDAVRRDVTEADEADVRAYLRRHVPEADVSAAASEVCMYTNTPDDHFIIDRYPKREDFIVVGGFSGHGFKFAPVVGEIVADLATHGRTEQPVDLFSLRRFLQA